MKNFNLNYEPSKRNIIRTLIGLLILHYFIFFQRHNLFFSFIIFHEYQIEYTRFGQFLYSLGLRDALINFFHIIISFSLLYSYWHFRKKITCFIEELIKKFIQKV
jgi:hypothetical protein